MRILVIEPGCNPEVKEIDMDGHIACMPMEDEWALPNYRGNPLQGKGFPLYKNPWGYSDSFWGFVASKNDFMMSFKYFRLRGLQLPIKRARSSSSAT